jgi:hypothetical protein
MAISDEFSDALILIRESLRRIKANLAADLFKSLLKEYCAIVCGQLLDDVIFEVCVHFDRFRVKVMGCIGIKVRFRFSVYCSRVRV